MIATPATGVGVVFQPAAVAVDSDASLKRQYPTPGGAFFFARESTDAIGQYTLTLTNLIVGSAVQIEKQSGGTLVNRVATGTTEVFALGAYGSGNPSNDLRIKVRKGSAAPFYQPFETQAAAFVGSQSIFVAQIPD